MMNNDLVRTTLASISLDIGSSFFEKYTLAELNVASHIKKEDHYETAGKALIAIRALEDGKFLHSFSAAWPGNGRIYLMHANTADRDVAAAIAGRDVFYKKLYSAHTVPMENLCDLIVKYNLLGAMPPGNTVSRRNGVFYKCSEKLAVNVRFRSDPVHPGHAIIQAAGKNMKKTDRTEGTPYPFYFSSTGVMVYSEHTPDRRYVWKTLEDKFRTKITVMSFGKPEDYETSASMFRCVNRTVRMLADMPGVTVTPVIWEGKRHAQRIGVDKELYRQMDAAAAAAIAKGGIAVRTGDGVPVSIKKVMKQYLGVLFSAVYECKSIPSYGEDSRYTYLRIKGRSVNAVKISKKMYYPQFDDGEAVFDLRNKKGFGISVKSITAYAGGKNESTIEAELYDEDGSLVERVLLNPDKNPEDIVFSMEETPIRDDGLYVIELIHGLEKDVHYEKDLHIQHITQKTITDFNEKRENPVMLCRNLVYQLVVKSDILSNSFTFLDIPELKDYEFIYSYRGCFVTMTMLDGRHFKISESSQRDKREVCFLEGAANEEQLKKHEYYAIRTPSGQFFSIQDSGLMMMPDLEFSGKDATRGGKETNEYLAPFLDYVTYDIDGEQYYSAGWDLVKANRQSYSYMPKIRRLATFGDVKLDMNLFFKTLNVPFVWMAQKNTVVPFPFKYLREYAALIIPPEKEDDAVSESEETENGGKKKTKRRKHGSKGKKTQTVIEKDRDSEPMKQAEKAGEKRVRIAVTALKRPAIIAFAQVLDPGAYMDGSSVFVTEEWAGAVKDFLAKL